MSMDDKEPEDSTEDTPIERLLREALSARATLITAQDLRPAEPPRGRLRRIRPLYTIGTPLFALAAASALVFVGLHTRTVADQGPAPAASLTVTTVTTVPTPSPTSGPSSTSASPAAPSGGAATDASSAAGSGPASAPAAVTLGPVQQFRGVSFRLPTGWTTGATGPLNDVICLQSPGGKQAPGGSCAPFGVELTVYSTPFEVSHANYPTAAELNVSGGWAHQPYCYSWDNPHQTDKAGATETETSSAPAKSTVALAGATANLSTWQVSCGSGDSFTARLWGLTDQQVFLRANGLSVQYEGALQAILGSLAVTDRPNPGKAGAVEATITTSGFEQGQKVSDDNAKVPFSVTFANNGSSGWQQVVPQVVSDQQASGTLEQQLDDGSWLSVPLLSATASGPPSNVPAFALPAGGHKTVNYRISFGLHTFSGPSWRLRETAFLRFPQGDSLSVLGDTSFNLPTIPKSTAP